MMTNSVPTPSRAAIVDYSHPIAFIAVSYIIPSSSYQSNTFFSASEPFQTWVSCPSKMSFIFNIILFTNETNLIQFIFRFGFPF